VGGNSKKIQVYKLKTGEYFCTMTGHKDSVTCFAEDGYFLITGSDD
jgi:WD40 repeat protein